MATIIIGCDKNNSNDSKFQNAVANKLKKAGHNVQKLTISPNAFATYSYKSKAKGKIGVYLMAGSLVSFLDAANSNFKYSYFGIRGDASRTFKSWSAFKTKGVPKDWHGDCPASLCDKWAGKTYVELNKAFKNRCKATFGNTPEELANNLLKEISGESSIGGNGKESLAKKVSQGGSIKEALQKLLTHWDGKVECYIRGNEVHVNKVRDPEKYHSCILEEGFNVFADSVNLTDVNPNTPNYLEVVWKGGSIVIKDEKLIDRFGIIRMNVIANNEANVSKTTTKKKVKKEK